MQRTPWNKQKKLEYKLNLSNNVCHDSILIDEVKELFVNLDIDPSQYPDEYKVYDALSNYYNIDIDNICIGFGSGEIMSRILNVFSNKSISIISPTWQIPEVLSEITGMDYSLDYNPSADILYIATPNGQNGQDFDFKNLISNHELVIIDEAYNDFSDVPSLVPNIPDNVIVLKTLSKSLGLAGIRLGYAFANNDLIDMLQQVRPNYVTSCFVSESINTLLNMIPKHVERMKETRDYIESNYDCVKSNANFVLFKNPPKFINKYKTKEINGLTRMSLLNLKDFIDASQNDRN
jgi:histidinol-phosphate aminotransferase